MNKTTLKEASTNAVAALLNKRINHPRIGEVIAEVDALAGLGAWLVGVAFVGQAKRGHAAGDG